MFMILSSLGDSGAASQHVAPEVSIFGLLVHSTGHRDAVQGLALLLLLLLLYSLGGLG